MLTAELTNELTALVEGWMRDKKILQPNKTVIVSVQIASVAPVSVQIAGEIESDDVILQKVIQRMHSRISIRMENIIYNNKLTLEILKTKSLDEMLKCRNLGRKILIEFASSLRIENIQCVWMEDLNIEESKRSQKKTEICEVEILTESDWITMITSLSYPTQSYNKIQVLLLEKLKVQDNSPLLASSIMPRSLDKSRYRLITRLMNLRWSSKKLPYRVSYVRQPSVDNLLDGTMQIVKIKK